MEQNPPYDSCYYHCFSLLSLTRPEHVNKLFIENSLILDFINTIKKVEHLDTELTLTVDEVAGATELTLNERVE